MIWRRAFDAEARRFGSRSAEARDRLLERVALLTLGVLIATLPLVAGGAYWSWVSSRNDIVEWAAPDLPSQGALRRFFDRFGRPETIVFAWPDCVLDSVVPARIVHALDSAKTPYFTHVVSAHDLLKAVDGVGGIGRDEAIRRLRGVLIGPDDVSCWIVAVLSDVGFRERSRAVDAIREAVAEAGVAPEELRLGGLGMNAYWLDVETKHSPQRIAPFAGALMFLLSWWSTRSLLQALVVCVLSGYCGLICAAAPYWAGVETNALLSIAPTLTSLLAVSSSLHFLRYIHHEEDDSERRPSIRNAVRLAIRPSLAAAVTTVAGLLSLAFSETRPVQIFGYVGALGVCVEFMLVFLVLPGLVSRYAWFPSSAEPKWPSSLFEFLRRRKSQVIWFIWIAMLASAAGIPRITTGVDLQNFFSASHPAIRHAAWLEERVGGLLAVEVMVRFNHPKPNGFLDRIGLVSMLERELARERGVVGTLSAASLLPDLPESNGTIPSVAQRWLMESRLNSLRGQFVDFGYLRGDSDAECFRVSALVKMLDWRDNHGIEQRLFDKAERVLRLATEPGSPGIICEAVGLGEVYEEIQQQLVDDLLVTYAGCVASVGFFVWLVFRRFGAALLLMLPNLMPAVLTLGTLGWLGVRLDVGSVITASIALGIAVDNTVHLSMWVDRLVQSGDSRESALRRSLRQCGPVMLRTTLVCGLGLLSFGVAPFLSTARFGFLMGTMLAVGLVGDLILLPCMLLSRFGNWIIPDPVEAPDSSSRVAEGAMPS